MTDELTLRFKYLCGRYWRILVPALVLVSAVAFATAAVGVSTDAGPEQVTVETDAMAVETTLSTRATVGGNTTLYERNETLTDMPVYLRSATPEVRLTAVTETPSDRTVSVTQQIVLTLTATRNGEVFWQDSRTLAIDSENVTDGTMRTTATLDVQQLARQQLANVTAETGGVGTVRATVSAGAVYETDAYRGRTRAATPLRVTDRAYELETPQRDRQTNATTVQQAVNGEASAGGPANALSGGPIRDVGSSVGGLVALGLASLILYTGRSIGDFDSFRRHYERVRYVEWISRGSIPASGKHVRVPVERLVDLVDIAIDSEKRVIHDTSKDTYAVVDGSLMYEFRDDDTGNMNEFGFAPTTALTEAFATGAGSTTDDAETPADTDSWFDVDSEAPNHDADFPPDADS